MQKSAQQKTFFGWIILAGMAAVGAGIPSVTKTSIATTSPVHKGNLRDLQTGMGGTAEGEKPH